MTKDRDNTTTGKGTAKTPEVRFLLKEPKSKKTTLIRAVYRYGGKKLVYTTLHKIKPNLWEKKKQRPIISYKYYQELKRDLNEIEESIVEVFKGDRNIELKKFRETLDIKLKRVTKEAEPIEKDFLDFITDFIIRKRALGELSENTLKKYQTVSNKLKEFNAFTGLGIGYEDFNVSFRDHYLLWLYEETKTKSANTANKDFATIRILLKKAFKEKLHSNQIFNDEDFGVARVKTSKIAFDEDEIETLYKYTVKPHEKLRANGISVPFAKKVKDWFLVAAYSSLRWSDFTNISEKNIVTIKDGLFIHTWTQKPPPKEVYIPINENLLRILKEYNYKSPQMSSQRFNEAIKVVCDLAGLTKKELCTKNIKGKSVTTQERKCDEVSSHDGRRTWASINYAKGFPILLLMQVTGHSKESTFLGYIGVSKKNMAVKLMAQMKAQESRLKVV